MQFIIILLYFDNNSSIFFVQKFASEGFKKIYNCFRDKLTRLLINYFSNQVRCSHIFRLLLFELVLFFFYSIGSIIATIAGVIGILIIVLIVLCCVCPCCILYKRRTNGTVYRCTYKYIIIETFDT